jgi:glycosyltransferase involved in cell wall biosynthesis
VDDAAARSIISASDLMLCTSHDEGLCLPLIEVQYSRIPVIAPDKAIFREVLGSSGIFVKPRAPEQAANQIADVITVPSWRVNYATASRANIVRWNTIAEIDRANVISFLSNLAPRRA